MQVKKLASLCSSLFLFFILQFSPAASGQMPALSPLKNTGKLSLPSDPTKFVFVLAGDNRPAHKTCKQPPTPGLIFAAVKALNPPAAFVLWTGDTISGKQPNHPKRMHEQYDEFLKIAATAGVPVFNAPGNHEMDDDTNVPSDAMKALYRKDMAETYGAFSFGKSRFIALDSENEPEKTASAAASVSGSKQKSEAPGAITQKQLKLLKKDLEDNHHMDHVIIFMHHPVVPYEEKDGLDPDSVKALQKTFAEHKNISYVVSGHEHMYYNSQGDRSKQVDPPVRKDPSQPPYYLVSGGGGAPLKKNTPGSFFHYIVFTVDGETIAPVLYKVDSSDPCDEQK